MRLGNPGRRIQAFVLFSLLMLPFGLIVHLAAESIAVGWGIDFIGRHHYMLAGAAVGVLTFLTITISSRGASALRELVAALPDRGRGARFFAFSVAIQLAVAFGTQAGEGLVVPVSSLIVVFIAGLVAASIGALTCGLVAQRLLKLFVALPTTRMTPVGPRVQYAVRRSAPRRPAHAFAPGVFSRPPPSR